ncbi:MAG: hypothetical protein PHX38_09965 [Sulfuricella sp.]|nr:hypothetical protein [Sulfuricella sp.]
MKLFIYAGIIVAGLSLGGCASLFPPKAETPVVRYGEAAPNGKEFITLFPAGAPLPVIATVDGTLLERKVSAAMQVALKRDVYLYREWLSFDGKNWLSSRDAVGGEFLVELPGVKDGKNPGAMSAEFNLK